MAAGRAKTPEEAAMHRTRGHEYVNLIRQEEHRQSGEGA